MAVCTYLSRRELHFTTHKQVINGLLMKEFIISDVKTETAVLVGLITKEQNEDKTKEYLDELEFLADTAGAVTVKRFTQRVTGPSAVTYVGKGKLEEIRDYIKLKDEEEEPIGMVIFDDELSAKQIRNIEKELGCQDIRPYLAHPRYICYARTDSQCQDAGGAGSVSLYAASLATSVDSPRTTRRWFWLWRW